jgi:hypothetical protein
VAEGLRHVELVEVRGEPEAESAARERDVEQPVARARLEELWRSRCFTADV